MTARKLRALIAKAAATPTSPIVSPAMAGPTMRAPLNIAELSATTLPMSSRPTISTANDWRTGMSTALAQPSRSARTMIIGTVTSSVDGQDREDDREGHHHGLDDDQGRALGQGVREHAREQPEDHDRDELGGGHDPEPERVVGQLEDQPGLGDLLHPGADERDRLAAEEQPVVAMAEGGDAAGAHHRAAAASCVGVAARSSSARPARMRRSRARASSIIAPIRSAFASSRPICRSTRARASSR